MIDLVKGNSLEKHEHLYHTPEWTNFIEEAYGIEIHTLNIELSKNRMQLLLPIKNRRIILPPLWAYNLPVFLRNPTIPQQIEFAKILHDFLSSNFSSFTFNWNTFHHTYTLSRYAYPYYDFTIKLPVSPPKTTKRKMKKLNDYSMNISETLTNDKIKKYYLNLQTAYKKKKSKIPYSFNVFFNIVNRKFTIVYELETSSFSSMILLGIHKESAYNIIISGENIDILTTLALQEIYENHKVSIYYTGGANTPGIIDHKMRYVDDIYPLIKINKKDTVMYIKQFIKDKLCL